MVCIYCNSETKVTNSRHLKRTNTVWRRRNCLSCAAVFTTHEASELATSIMVKKPSGALSPFLKEKLFISIYESCRHRKNAITDAAALTDTIISRLFSKNLAAGTVDEQTITTTAAKILSNFDKVAATYYGAYYSKLS